MGAAVECSGGVEPYFSRRRRLIGVVKLRNMNAVLNIFCGNLGRFGG